MPAPAPVNAPAVLGPGHPGARPLADPDELVNDWAEAGLISPVQAVALHHDLEQRAERERPGLDVASLLVEGVGYLGGAIVVAATLIIAGRYWHDFGSALRVGLAGAAAAGTLAAALLTSSGHAAAARVRAVLLSAAVITFGTLVAVIGHEYGSDSLHLALVVTLASTGYAGLLWWRNPTPLQQLTTGAAVLALAAVAVHELHGPGELTGAGPWAIGVGSLLLAWGGLLRPRRVVEVLAAVVAVVGAMSTIRTDAGDVLAVCTAVALVAAGILVRNLGLLAVGSIGTLVSVTVTVSDWFPGALSAPLALLVVGGALVAVAVVVARRRRTPAPAAALAEGSPRVAVAAAAAVVVATAATVVAIALTWQPPPFR